MRPRPGGLSSTRRPCARDSGELPVGPASVSRGCRLETGGWGGTSGPDLSWSSRSGDGGAFDPARGLEQSDRSVDLRLGLVAVEQVPDLRARNAAPGRGDRPPDRLGDAIGERVAEDEGRRARRVVPQRERGPQVGDADRVGVVQEGVDEGETDDMGLGAPQDSAEQPAMACAETPVGVPPQRSRLSVEAERSLSAGALDGTMQAPLERGELHLVELSPVTGSIG